MVEVNLVNVTKRFGNVIAVDHVNMKISGGEFFFVLGPSGCGKTTLLRLIAGFITPDEGEIWLGDKIVNELPAHKRNVVMVFQNYALFPHMTVFENVAYGLKMKRLSKSEIKEKVERYLELVKMSDVMWHYPAQLSGGQQQRVALARALAVEPDVLLLDEPLSNLDAQLRKEMRQELKRIHSQLRITTIYVTHDQKEALAMADRIAVMRSGRIEQIGTPIELYRKPANRYVAEFISDANIFEGVIEKVGMGRMLVRTPLCVVECNHERGLEEGQKVTLAIRPAALHVERLQAGLEDTAPNKIIASVYDVTYLGDEEMLELCVRQEHSSKMTTIKALRANPHEQVALGDEVVIKFDASDVIVIPSDETAV
jgi:spermidine/putrescine ABC transporter ATP-binding subunit